MADYNSSFTGAQIDAAITKVNGIEAGADVTDTANVTAAGALMDSEVTNLADVKAFDPADYATAAQGGLADSAVQPGDDADTLGSGDATDGWVLTADGAGGAAWEASAGGGGTPAGSSGQFQYNDSSVFAAADLWQATNVIEQRNGTNAQTFNIYNITDAAVANYERGFMKWNSNVLEIGTEAAGTGAARPVRFVGASSNDVSVLGSSSASLTLRTGTFPGTIRTSMFAGFGLGVVATETAHPLVLRSQGVERVRLDTVGSVQIATALTVATLPGTPLTGMMARVTDGDSGLTFGNTVVNSGAGATPYLVWYNGTNWTVIGA